VSSSTHLSHGSKVSVHGGFTGLFLAFCVVEREIENKRRKWRRCFWKVEKEKKNEEKDKK
jgi:hypothetical protein